MKKKLEEKKMLKNEKFIEHHFYVSNFTHNFEKSAKLFFKETIKLKELNLFF